MALFKKTTKADKAPKAEKVDLPAQAGKAAKAPATKAPAAAKPALALSAMTSVLVRPHITEKAGLLAQSGVYTFEVTRDADEASVIRAVAEVYKVAPLRASLMPIKTKAMFARGRRGTTGGGKKAYVYLPKGQTIEFI